MGTTKSNATTEKANLDLLGIGFGPANLSLSIALSEPPYSPSLSAHFFDAKAGPEWHPGLLLPGATMQISFLKDLVTQRNPRSRYSFLNFLKETGRLPDFINIRQFHPLRTEFADYLKWVAGEMAHCATYRSQVLDIVPLHTPSGTVHSLRVSLEGPGGGFECDCRNLSLAVGGLPKLPADYAGGIPEVIHSSEFLLKLPQRFPERDRPYRFAVVGSGQSAAEMLLYLHREYPASEVTGILRGFGLRQADSSCFINELFDNRHTDTCYFGNDFVRKVMLDRSTNYSVVDEKELRALYDIVYEERFFQRQRLHFQRFTELRTLSSKQGSVALGLHHLDAERTSQRVFDGVFLGTGYRRRLEHPLLQKLRPYFLESNGEPQVERNYRVATVPDFTVGVYVQGVTEHTHGIGNTLLSNVATRAGEIAESILSDSRRRLQDRSSPQELRYHHA